MMPLEVLKGFRWIRGALGPFGPGDKARTLWHLVRPASMQAVCEVTFAGEDAAYEPDVIDAAKELPPAPLGAERCGPCTVWLSMIFSDGLLLAKRLPGAALKLADVEGWTCPYCVASIPKRDTPEKTWTVIAQDHIGAECTVAPWRALLELVDKAEAQLFQGRSLANVLRLVSLEPPSPIGVDAQGRTHTVEVTLRDDRAALIREVVTPPLGPDPGGPSMPVFRPPPEHAVAVGLMETLGDKRNEEAERRVLEAAAGTPLCRAMFAYVDGSEARCELSAGHLPANLHRAPGFEDRMRSEGKPVVPSLAEVQNDPSLLSALPPK